MAKEMILLPKLKYEHLRRLRNEDECVQNDNHKDQKTENKSLNVSTSPQETNTNTGDEMPDVQSGGAYISKIKTVSGPPGVSRTKRKRQKNIPWLTY
jgi:hypothetical protein